MVRIATTLGLSANGLQELAAKYPKTCLALVKLNVTNVASIKKAAEEVAMLLPDGLDYLINNAGISPRPMTSFEDLWVPLYRLFICSTLMLHQSSDLKLLEDELSFNTITVIQVISAFLPLVKKSAVKKIVFCTFVLGSLELGGSWPFISKSYSISKAALNMSASRSTVCSTDTFSDVFIQQARSKVVTVALVHPG